MKIKTLFLMILSLFLILNMAIAAPFADLGGQTVLDRKTGLIWQSEDDGQQRKWINSTGIGAIEYCEDLILDGKNNWRLPNIRELRSIVDYSKSDPAIDISFFKNTKIGTNYYWSSTSKTNSTSTNTSTEAWTVKFKDGVVSDMLKSNATGYVRCVR